MGRTGLTPTNRAGETGQRIKNAHEKDSGSQRREGNFSKLKDERGAGSAPY